MSMHTSLAEAAVNPMLLIVERAFVWFYFTFLSLFLSSSPLDHSQAVLI
jgi:hypothetical protein